MIGPKRSLASSPPMPSSISLLAFVLFFCFQFTFPAGQGNQTSGPICADISCGGELGLINFPFTTTDRPDCGLCIIKACNEKQQLIQLEKGGRWYGVSSISVAQVISLQFNNCQSLTDFRLPQLPYINFSLDSNLTLLSCNGKYTSGHFHAELAIKARLTHVCGKCHYKSKGLCKMDSNKKFYCSTTKHGGSSRLKLGIGIGGSVIILLIILFYIAWRSNKLKHATSYCFKGNIPNLSSKSDLEDGSIYPGVHTFSYNELEKVTNNFDSERELGDGGFGSVFYGKLKDGREVAIKRLYQHNYRRVEQFMNEVDILARLRHKNLVSLYGCTSRRSRELVLVYEYVSNGTVADHLHGHQAEASPLTWPIRMSIAIETASALAYLHASDVIHRDVKTDNILLDSNFCVKVADFGLSKLFPTDVTHISTAPQGTPGYVDPEYYQCYQLTDKSDVYSFGVVLVELISAMPAVDFSRHRYEVNLANLAINRIQAQAVHELIDQRLWDGSSEAVQRMITAVAELAFQCLQQEKEMRPTMDEVLDQLHRIQEMEHRLDNMEGTEKSNDEQESVEPPSLSPYDEDVLLKTRKQPPPSPISVTEKWISRSTTPNTSG